MTRFAIIDAGSVTNIIKAEAEFAASIGAIDATGASIGDLWDGKTFIKPPPLTPVVPQSVTMCQARLVLQATGKYAEVNSAISSMTGPNGDNARIEWEFRTEVNRNQLLVTSIGKLLKLSESEIDDLFIAAAAL